MHAGEVALGPLHSCALGLAGPEEVYMYRILPKISPPFVSSRHGPDWGGGLYSNMHNSPRI
jgi:hypothetical protein